MPTLLIMAAGMGSRYGGLKQMDSVGPCGETLLDYSIFDAARSGFKKVVFIIRKDFDAEFRRRVGSRFSSVLPVEYVHQEIDDIPGDFQVPEGRTKPWGTGHAVLAARHVIREPFCLVNADDFYGREAFEEMAGFLTGAVAPDVHALVAYNLQNTLSENGTVSRGLCRDDGQGFLASVRELTSIGRSADGIEAFSDPGIKLNGSEPVSMNFWGFHPAIFPVVEKTFHEFLANQIANPKSEFYIPYAVDALIQSGKAKVRLLRCDSEWFGVTYREDREPVQKAIKSRVDSGEYPAPLTGLALDAA